MIIFTSKLKWELLCKYMVIKVYCFSSNTIKETL